MNSTQTPMTIFARLFFIMVVFMAAQMDAAPVPGDHRGRKLLISELSDNASMIRVTVPVGVTKVVVQGFHAKKGWVKFADHTAIVGLMKLPIKQNSGNLRWRAIGIFPKDQTTRPKFPPAFYQGSSKFEPIAGNGSFGITPRVSSMGVDQPETDLADPVEADIWKVDGNRVYFFNQLRGLQVIDIQNPADPRLVASLRLPASGQDLFLLPGTTATGGKRLALLTSGWTQKGDYRTEIQMVHVEGGTARLTSTQAVPGYLTDSRMMGNRLVLATTEYESNSGLRLGFWHTQTRLTEWILDLEKAPRQEGDHVIEGSEPLIAAGSEWLAVAVHPNNRWDISEVSLFSMTSNGLRRIAAPFTTEGAIPSKFNIQWKDHVLTTISERNGRNGRWEPTTVLENFRASTSGSSAPEKEGRLASLELAKGESLFSTRFAGDKAYIVTFLRVDPLFVIDLSDPYSPKIAGEIKIPGWSTYLEPIGDFLFSIGWEDNAPVASLFDVSDPQSPSLASRVTLGNAGTYSEALWDEKALNLLPEAGLVLIPLTTHSAKAGQSVSQIKLLDVDVATRSLTLRGGIEHEFDARRGDLIGNTVLSVSQRVLVAADITDRDLPKIVSKVALAWPVNQVVLTGDHVLQIEAGGWYGGNATVRVSPANALESILNEVDLGRGTVKSAEIRGGKLVVLKQANPVYYHRSVVIDESTSKLTLDVYDISALPELKLLGTCSLNPQSNGELAAGELLWPHPDKPAVILNRQSYWFGWGPILMIAETNVDFANTALTSHSMDRLSPLYYNQPQEAPRLVVFNIANPAAPVVESITPIGPPGTAFHGIAAAADGRVVMGNSQKIEPPENADMWVYDFPSYEGVRVINVETSGSPIVGPFIDLPGQLAAITELDRKGFLAFSQTSDAKVGEQIQVSACDGADAFLIASLSESSRPIFAADGTHLFVVRENGVARFQLSPEGQLQALEKLELGFTPYTLHLQKGTLIGMDGDSLFAVDKNSGQITEWEVPTWIPSLEDIEIGNNGKLFVPLGEYGVLGFER